MQLQCRQTRASLLCRRGNLIGIVARFMILFVAMPIYGLPPHRGPHSVPVDCAPTISGEESPPSELTILSPQGTTESIAPDGHVFPPAEVAIAMNRFERIVHAIETNCRFDKCTKAAMERVLGVAGDLHRKVDKWYDRPSILVLRRGSALVTVLAAYISAGPIFYYAASRWPKYLTPNAAQVLGASMSGLALFVLFRFASTIEKALLPKWQERFVRWWGPGKNDKFSQITTVEAEEARVARIRHAEQTDVTLKLAPLAAQNFVEGNLEVAARYYGTLLLAMINRYHALHFNEPSLIGMVRLPPLPDPISRLEEKKIVQLLETVIRFIENTDEETLEREFRGDRREVVGTATGILLTWLVGINRMDRAQNPLSTESAIESEDNPIEFEVVDLPLGLRTNQEAGNREAGAAIGQ
jgi:hypothetical protein